MGETPSDNGAVLRMPAQSAVTPALTIFDIVTSPSVCRSSVKVTDTGQEVETRFGTDFWGDIKLRRWRNSLICGSLQGIFRDLQEIWTGVGPEYRARPIGYNKIP
jgi:hypothetical protein